MSVWALSDLHLAFSVPSKTMEVFGPNWLNYANRIKTHWESVVSAEDLVLIPGDICWAMRLEEARIDLEWIHALPGTKVILRGNHDYWWSSSTKMQKIMPASIHFIQNDVLTWNAIAIGGSRLWDTQEYHFNAFNVFRENPHQKEMPEQAAHQRQEEEEKIFLRELERLKLSLSQIPEHITQRIALTHYPPIGADLAPSRAAAILESYQINTCVFGHLHNIRPGSLNFGKARGVDYKFASCDYLEFIPLKIR